MVPKKQVFAVVLAAAFCTTARATTLVLSAFGSSAEGWSIADLNAPASGAVPGVAATYAVTYSATGGNPGGYIYETDPSGNDYYFQAPPSFLGNQTAALNGTFSFDIADSPITSGNPPASSLILVGTTESIYFPYVNSVTVAFSKVSFTLAPGYGGTVNGLGGIAATGTDFSAVLGNLQAVYVLGDYNTGTDTAKLDNVALNSVPEPTTTTTAGLCAAAGAAWFFKRRQRRPSNTF